LAQRGVVPQEMADNAMQMWIQQSFPQVAEQQLEQLQMQEQMQNLPPELQAQMLNQTAPEMQIPEQEILPELPIQNNQRPLTQPAIENLLAGISPAL